MIESFTVTVPAPSGEQARTATVYLPEIDAPCAVLYLFDGQTAFSDARAPFGSSLRLGDFLAAHAVPLIAVGVDCDKRDRLTEYSPFPFRERGGIVSEGKGKAYMDWLTGDFKRTIDARYKTLPDRRHTFLMGSSMGGLMAMYGLSAYGHVFSRAVSMSAAVWVDIVKSAALVGGFAKDAALYFDYGTGEFSPKYPKQREALAAVEAALAAWGGEYRFHLIQGAKHNEEAWRQRLPAALRFLGF